jgi:hypothetical protein
MGVMLLSGAIDSERIKIEIARINAPTLALPRDAGEGNKEALKLFECRIYKGLRA